MFRRLRAYFTTLQYPYADAYEERLAQNTLLAVQIFGIVLLLLLYLPLLLITRGNLPTTVQLALVAAPIGLIVMAVLTQTGRVRWAVLQFLVVLTIICLGIFYTSPQSLINYSAMFVPIVAAGVLSSRRITLAVAALTMAVLAFSLLSRPSFTINIVTDARITNLVLTAGMFAFITSLMTIFGFNAQRLAAEFSRELGELRRVLNTPELTDINLTEQQIIRHVLETARRDFGYSQVQIALIDSNRQTAQRYYASFGMDEVQRGESLELQTANPLAEVMRTGQSLVITSDSSDTRRRHLLPGIQVGVIVPIVSPSGVLGALDMQSNERRATGSAQMEVYNTYGERLGSALERARSMTQLREDVSSQAAIIENQRQRLRELERVERVETVADSWALYFEQLQAGLLGFDLDMRASAMTAAVDLPPEIHRTLERNELHILTEDNHQIVSAPIAVQNQLLGALSFRMPAGVMLSTRQRELIFSVVQRLGLALENRRLYEQSQAEAVREAKANEVASLLLSTTDVQAVLRMAAESFNEALGAVQTRVHLRLSETGEAL
jgi:GAF domain-containing protein